MNAVSRDEVIAVQLADAASVFKLTLRECQVLACLIRGHGNKQAAQALFVDEETIKAHVRHILKKTRASNRTHAVALVLIPN